MKEHLILQAVFFMRIVLAGICGMIIGYERKNRGKGAGIRTHFIVALASALMIIISKYGFADLNLGGSFKLDPSRIAAQIVSGVGFLGAGMIFIYKHAIKGLTTAAGIWATAGIGMAVGSGMYILGIAATTVILIAQIILHRNFKFNQMPSEETMKIVLYNKPDAVDYLKNYLKEKNIGISNINVENSAEKIRVSFDAAFDADFDETDFLDMSSDYVESVSTL